MPKTLSGRITPRQHRDIDENKPQTKPDALCAFLDRRVEELGGVKAVAEMMKNAGGTGDQSVVSRWKNGARAVQEEQVVALAVALGCAKGRKAAAFSRLVANASMLRLLERHLARTDTATETSAILLRQFRKAASEAADVLRSL